MASWSAPMGSGTNSASSDVDRFVHKARGLLNTLVLNVALLRKASDGLSDAEADRIARYAQSIERDVRRLAAHLAELRGDDGGER